MAKGYEEEQAQQPRPAKRGGGGGGEQSADSSGGRSTGWITGFGGGKTGGSGSPGGSKGSAVVKATKYAKAGKANSAKSVKASSRYYTTRENERGDSMERESFSKDRDDLTREEAYERLERADQEHEYHTRIVLGPDTDREAGGVDLKEYTREVMGEVERRAGGASWVAVEHGRDTAHSEHAHVHVIVSTDEKLNRKDLERLRDHASRSWDEARDNHRSLERDPGIEREIKEMSRERDERIGERSPAREVQPQLPERTPERVQEHEFERDGGRGR